MRQTLCEHQAPWIITMATHPCIHPCNVSFIHDPLLRNVLHEQAMRQTLLKKYAKVRSAVERLHNSRMSPYETMECHEAIRSEIAACWRTDEIRRTKPTPQASI